MHYVGIDLHKRTVVIALEDEKGPFGKAKTFSTQDTAAMLKFFDTLKPFRAVIESSSSYRWLYDLLSPLGTVILAHPLKMRAIVSARAKTDKLDAAMLAKLLRADLIPESYVPPQRYQELRNLTRTRARLSREATKTKNQIHFLLGRLNLLSPFRNVFCKRGLKWTANLPLTEADGFMRDELLRRLAHYGRELQAMDAKLESIAENYPEIEAIDDLHGVGLYSALLIVAELGEPDRFDNDRQVGAYAGLTARVNQSGGHDYHGHITHQGSSWLRWILVQAAMNIVRKDIKLQNFYTRIRKRSSAKIARVAVARKLASICWVRLKNWHRKQAA